VGISHPAFRNSDWPLHKALHVIGNTMMHLKNLLFAVLVTIFTSCNNSHTGIITTTKPLIIKDTTNEIEKKNMLFVFVGEKISVTAIPHKPGDFDNGVDAKYKILQPVYGNYNKSVIEFKAYDHYGTPEFTKYKTVLLFVTEYEGKFYQEKYMFDPLAMTKDGRWAGPYSSEFDHPYNKYTTVKPVKVDFVEEISYPIKVTDDEGKENIFKYKDPYFKTVGNKAVAVYGNYIPELFKLRRDGVLTARDLFPGKNEIELKLSKDSTSDNN